MSLPLSTGFWFFPNNRSYTVDKDGNVITFGFSDDTITPKYQITKIFEDGTSTNSPIINFGVKVNTAGLGNNTIITDKNNNFYTTGWLDSTSTFYSNPLTTFYGQGKTYGYVLKFNYNTTGIKGLNLKDNFKIYPNPTSGLFTIEGIKVETIITIYDITGKAISKNVLNTLGKTELEIEGSPGIYFIEVITEQGKRQVFKVVKI